MDWKVFFCCVIFLTLTQNRQNEFRERKKLSSVIFANSVLFLYLTLNILIFLLLSVRQSPTLIIFFFLSFSLSFSLSFFFNFLFSLSPFAPESLAVSRFRQV